MTYPLITAEGSIPSWGAAGFYNTMLGLLTQNSATLNQVGEDQDITAIGGTTYAGFPGLYSWSGNISATAYAGSQPRLGNGGTVVWSSPTVTISHIDGWRCRIDVPTHDITSVAAAPLGYRYFRPDIPKITGSFTARHDNDANFAPPTAAGTVPASCSTLTLKLSEEGTDPQLSGLAMIRQVGFTQQRGGLQLVNYEFTFVSTVTTVAGTNSYNPLGGAALGIPLWDQLGSTTNTLLTFTATTGETYAGSAFYTSIEINNPVGAAQSWEIGYQGTGVLTPVHT